MRGRPPSNLLTAVAATATLVLVSLAGASSAQASFSVQETSAAQSTAAASLGTVTAAEAHYDASGTATAEWSTPAIRPDVAAEYTVQRSVEGGTATTISPSIADAGGTTSFTDDLTVPSTIEGKTVTAISAGSNATCAIAEGKAYCWGRSSNGQVGDGDVVNRPAPVAVVDTGVLSDKTVTDISVATEHACVVADGRAYCWGNGSFGRLGNNSTLRSTVPSAVVANGVLAQKTVTAIAAGELHTCAVADGAVYCWGRGANGQLGDNSTTQRNEPVAVDVTGTLAGKTVTDISLGGNHSCALAAGTVYCWGAGAYGQLGNGSKVDSPTPVAIDTSGALTGKAVDQVSAGDSHNCVVAAGKAYCWGRGATGRLGDGAAADRDSPVAVTTSGVLAGKTVTGISAGGSHSCAIASGGVFCWGAGSYGRLGQGTTSSSINPVAVVSTGPLSGRVVTGITAGFNHSCAVAGEGAYCWGRGDTYGAIGTGLLSDSTVPVASTGALLGHTCAVDWLLTDTDRCAPGAAISVSYHIDYTKAGWSTPGPADVTADWEP